MWILFLISKLCGISVDITLYVALHGWHKGTWSKSCTELIWKASGWFVQVVQTCKCLGVTWENMDGVNGQTGGKNHSSTFVLTAFTSFGWFKIHREKEGDFTDIFNVSSWDEFCLGMLASLAPSGSWEKIRCCGYPGEGGKPCFGQCNCGS
jgi:hypothetical protein